MCIELHVRRSRTRQRVVHQIGIARLQMRSIERSLHVDHIQRAVGEAGRTHHHLARERRAAGYDQTVARGRDVIAVDNDAARDRPSQA